jgi:ParB family chromosome partitioning protein
MGLEKKAIAVSRKDTVNSLFMTKLGPPNPTHTAEKSADRVRSGAVSAMGASLQEMSEAARTSARLQAQLANGATVVELDPAAIRNSAIGDRIPIEIDPGFDALVDSIRESGQQVPILVRPDPLAKSRFEIVYGRRRLRAAALLGKNVRAIVQEMSDSQLVVAQGKENLDREDLSFIEKANFARRLEDAGFDRPTIMAALSTDKGDLSRYISIARTIPERLMMAIGPAPKAGRARWVGVSERIMDKLDQVDALVHDAAFLAADSDVRFARVFALLHQKLQAKPPKAQEWKSPSGKKAVRIERGDRETRLTFDERHVPEFGSYLSSRLDDLYAEFSTARHKPKAD